MTWHDNLPPGKSWASLWTGYILCGECQGNLKWEHEAWITVFNRRATGPAAEKMHNGAKTA